MNIRAYEEFKNININAWRNGYNWSVNECLRLEREYDLLELSVPEMAVLHKRTMNAIMCKLQAEELDTFNNLYIKTYGEDHIDEQINKLNNLCSAEEDDDEDDEDDDEDDDDEDYEEEEEDEDDEDDDEDDDDEDYEEEEEDEEDEDDDEDDDDEDYEEEEEDEEDEEDDEDYVPELNEGSKHAYMFEQVKRIHNHVSNLLNYFTNTSVKKSPELNY